MNYELRISFIKHARKWRDFILDLIFPVECLGCNSTGEWLCQKCFSKIRLNKIQHCFHCKKEKTFGRFCASCRVFYSLDGVLIAGDYKDKLIAASIKNLKYKFVKEMADPLSDLLIIFIKDLLQRNAPFMNDLNKSNDLFKNKRSIPKIFFNFKESLVIPISLHKRRLRWRGFNQAEEIAKGLAKYFSLELRSDILSRAKYNKPQVKLKKKERLENIKGCFEIKSPLDKGGWGILSGRNILLIDDVATTGATLNEAARILKENGAAEVWGLVVANG